MSELKEFNPAPIYGFETENLGHSRTADELIARDNSICIPSDLQKARVYQDHLSVGKDTMLKLAVAYHNGRLSDQQQQVMTKLLGLPPLPSRVPYEMQKWVERLIKHYALCDKHNLAEVARFLAEISGKILRF